MAALCRNFDLRMKQWKREARPWIPAQASALPPARKGQLEGILRVQKLLASVVEMRETNAISQNSLQVPGGANTTSSVVEKQKTIPASVASVLEKHEAAPWVPQTGLIQNPRAVHNAAALAYIGDAVYELYVRRHFFMPAQTMDKYNGCVIALARCEAQDSLLQKLLNDGFLSQAEREVVKWGTNALTSNNRASKRAGHAAYHRATGLETLIGFLYLSNTSRLEELMSELGFNKNP